MVVPTGTVAGRPGAVKDPVKWRQGRPGGRGRCAPAGRRPIIYYKEWLPIHENIEKPFVYLDGKQLGKLGVNRHINVRVPAGRHVVEIKHSFLFMPAFNLGQVSFTTEQQKNYYVRYTYVFAGIDIWPGGNVSAQGKPFLELVDEAVGRQKR